MTKAELNFMIDSRVEALVGFLMEDKNMSLLDAFDRVYNSRTYRLLSNPQTGLYYQSAGYIYSYLEEECQ
ncbi:hypothetical protein HPS57_03530 [Prevotella sp. PINT]|jgi:hypothetical protein|uniref:hypothetical protein n=1 Tax=Palleniella intestinalis TaxID=2736291 RepID=UPI00155360AF|nr:hypothetical protein [Palleniella intestinalis]NPD81047.1 hypothetical protein [Palleniella intestinalis]